MATQKSGAARGDKMDLRCPKCNSTDLKKVSLAYEEGLYRGEGRTRLSAALVGGSGPDLMVGRATTDTSHQSALSKRLSPSSEVVLFESRHLDCSGFSLRRLDRLLRQHGCREFFNRVVTSTDILCFDFRRYLCFPAVYGLEAQQLYVQETIC